MMIEPGLITIENRALPAASPATGSGMKLTHKDDIVLYTKQKSYI